jgi:CheY-like chemotaxis protein
LDLSQLVSEVASLLDHTIGKHIDLHIIPEQPLAKVKGDPAHLETVILNLAINARDAMPDGGRLTIRTRNVTFDAHPVEAPTHVKPGSYVCLTVSDTGHGLSPEMRARIFEPFFTTKLPGKGTGLGLAIVDDVVKRMGGIITMASEVGKGTRFDIYLPSVDEKTGQASRPETVAVPLFGRETVLLADDDEQIRELAVPALRELGYTVLDAPDGEEALKLAGKHDGPIHLLVTDVVLPKMNGKQLAMTLLEEHPTVKILYVSGYGDSVITSFVGELEHGAFLPKPYTPSSLAGRIRELLLEE